MTTCPASPPTTAPARPRGRPPVGPDVKYRLTAQLRDQLADAKRPGESEAATVRRLLAVALNPLTTAALLFLAAHHEDLAAEFPDNARIAENAAALRQLADAVALADTTTTNASTPEATP